MEKVGEESSSHVSALGIVETFLSTLTNADSDGRILVIREYAFLCVLSIYLYSHTHIHTHTHIRTHTYIHTYIYLNTGALFKMYTCAYIYMCELKYILNQGLKDLMLKRNLFTRVICSNCSIVLKQRREDKRIKYLLLNPAIHFTDILSQASIGGKRIEEEKQIECQAEKKFN